MTDNGIDSAKLELNAENFARLVTCFEIFIDSLSDDKNFYEHVISQASELVVNNRDNVYKHLKKSGADDASIKLATCDLLMTFNFAVNHLNKFATEAYLSMDFEKMEREAVRSLLIDSFFKGKKTND
jgi:hypothetical protein